MKFDVHKMRKGREKKCKRSNWSGYVEKHSCNAVKLVLYTDSPDSEIAKITNFLGNQGYTIKQTTR